MKIYRNIYAKNSLLQSEAIAVRGSGIDSPAITDIKYNAKGQRTDIYYANGSKTRYFYDPATFRVTRILTTRNTGADILQDLNYIYDAVGNITQQKDDAQQTIYFANRVVEPLCKYSYDSLYRLIKATGRELSGLAIPSATDCPIQAPVPDTNTNACRNYIQKYKYDELGNILQIQHIASSGNWTQDYFYPADSNRLIGHTSGQTGYTYDAAGNMLTMPHLNSLAWNENNMPVEVDLGGGGTAYYRYDSQGQRVRKVIVNGNIKKERFYVGDFELWQQSTSGTVQTERETLNVSHDQSRFLQLETLAIDNGNSISNPTTNWRYQYDNHLGSACLELDNTAQVISYEEYFPFGSTSYRSGKSQAEVKLKRYRYCGKERDEESGLYYYGARYYASWLGRFISCDLLKNDYPQLTPYNYAGNKPVTYKDLQGLQSNGGDDEVKQDRKREIKPRDEHEDAIFKKELYFSANYGWIDNTHAFKDSTRDELYIGVEELWRQLKNEPSSEQIHRGYYSVNYKQDVPFGNISLGVERQYLVKAGLSLEERKSVALAIFQDVSIAFEQFQNLHPFSESSFSPEDLPSNILRFYHIVEGISISNIKEMIQPLSIEKSLEVYRSYPGTFTEERYKNRSFEPLYFDTPYTSENHGVPAKLNTINPEPIKSFRKFGQAKLILFEQDLIRFRSKR